MSSDKLTSDVKSDERAHSLNISAPYLSATSLGATPLPKLFDIFLPCPSVTNPCVNTSLYGAIPFIATLVNSEDWNHPLYWSFPSRYKSAGYFMPLSTNTL